MGFVWNNELECLRKKKKLKVKLIKASWDNPKTGVRGPQPGMIGTSHEQRKIDGDVFHYVTFWPEYPEFEGVWITPDYDVKKV